jgi:TatD DNase family protein
MVNIVDSHCHLDLPQFDEDRNDVLKRARENNVERILIPGIDLDACKNTLIFAKENEDVFVAIGVHPNYAEGWDDTSIDTMRKMAKSNRVVAIGEIGLDYYWDKTTPGLQKEIFSYQLDFARETQLPIIVHTRDSLDDIISLLMEWQILLAKNEDKLALMPGVVHSFSGSIEQAIMLMNHNFFIGITGPVTFKNAKELKELARMMPLDKLLIETDAPYLTPHPFRGKRNEPSYVKYVAEEIANLKNINIDEVIEKTTKNAKRLFKW